MIKRILITCMLGVLPSCYSISHIQRNPAIGMIDTIAIAENCGHDYVKLTAGALNRNNASLHQLLALSDEFDAAATEGHIGVLGEVLRRSGDDFFGEQLSKESIEVRSLVQEFLLYDFGWGNTEITKSELAQWYPLTFSGMKITE